MKILKKLISLAIVVLLLNGCGKVSNLLDSNSTKDPTPSPVPTQKDRQSVWSWFGKSSKPTSDKTNTSTLPEKKVAEKQ